MKTFLVALVLSFFGAGHAAQAFAQQKMETVIAIQDGELDNGTAHGISIKLGQSLNVYHRAAGRIWVVLNSADYPRSRTWGWMPSSYALPPDQAVRHFTDSLKSNPKDAAFYFGRASAELALEQHDKVIADCNQLVQLDPKSVLGLQLRARAEMAKEQPEKAIADLTAVLRLDPERVEAYRSRGAMWQKQEDFEKAMDDYSHLLRLAPNDCSSYYSRGICRLRKREFDKAIADFDEVLCRQPDTAYAYAGRGEAWHYLHAYEKAEDDMTDCVRLEESAAIATCRIAWRYFFLGNMPEAIADFKQLQKAIGRLSDSYLMRAESRNAVAESDRGFADLSEALWLNPNSVRGLGMRGLYWLDKKRFDLAMADFDAAMKLDPKFATTYHVMRGSCLAQQGKNEKALADFAEALRLEPNDQRACNNLAWFRATCEEAKYRDGKSALALARKACERSKWGSYATIDTLAASYAESGDFAEAVRWQKKALELAPPASQKKMADRLALYEAHKPYRTPVKLGPNR